MFAKVVVDVVSSNTDEIFTYHVPDDFIDYIRVGSRVYLEFGFQRVLGYVLELSDQTDYQGNIKDILDVIDFDEGLTDEQIQLAKEISKNTKSFLISSLDLMIPSILKSRLRKYINVINYNNIDADLALFFGFKKKILVTKEILTKYLKIKKEIDKGNLEIVSDIYAYGKRKTVRYYRLAKTDFYVDSEKRYAILSYIKNKGEATTDEIKNNTGCSDYLVQKLVQENLLVIVEKPLLQDQLEPKEEAFSKPIFFNFNQQQLKEKFFRLNNKPFLLNTNDEKFKLDFYLDIVYKTISEHKQVLIATPTLLSNAFIYQYFLNSLKGFRIFNFSSTLTNNEYYYNYQNVKAQNVDLIICTKSSIFLPLNNLGLIIVIDEDNNNYINEQHPRYDTLEVLKYRANYHNAKLLLSAKIPSIDAYYQYYTAKYFMLEYQVQYNNKVSLVNMKDEVEDRMLSRELKAKLIENFQNKKVSMLLLNNLSYNSAILCEDCGELITCPTCKVNITYHKDKELYRCPYCNSIFEDVKCETCGSHHIQRFGFGLEKLRESLTKIFPNANIYQIDSSSMVEKNSYEEFFSDLEENSVDIIIGTNHIIDIERPNISLIGIISIDSILNYSDYRSSEIAYKLVAKAMNYPNATCIIQGYNLSHFAILDAINNQFDHFFNKEIENRKNYQYPPFMEVNRLLITGEYKKMYYYANYFKKIFTRLTDGQCLGPTYQPRYKGVQLILKHQDYIKVSSLIDEVNNKFKDDKLVTTFERHPRIM